MKPQHRYPCPVCGYPLDEPATDSNICPSCGTQFGYSDSHRTYEELRREWVRFGAKWHSSVLRAPKNWNPTLQLLSAGLTIRIIADVASPPVQRKPVYGIEVGEEYRLVGETA